VGTNAPVVQANGKPVGTPGRTVRACAPRVSTHAEAVRARHEAVARCERTEVEISGSVVNRGDAVMRNPLHWRGGCTTRRWRVKGLCIFF
jgi:hypothetical protein